MKRLIINIDRFTVLPGPQRLLLTYFAVHNGKCITHENISDDTGMDQGDVKLNIIRMKGRKLIKTKKQDNSILVYVTTNIVQYIGDFNDNDCIIKPEKKPKEEETPQIIETFLSNKLIKKLIAKRANNIERRTQVLKSLSKFYRDELLESLDVGNDEYIIFLEMLYLENEYHQPLKAVLSLNKQMSFTQFLAIKDLQLQFPFNFSKMLLAMENHKDFDKKYSSLYLTFRKWVQHTW